MTGVEFNRRHALLGLGGVALAGAASRAAAAVAGLDLGALERRVPARMGVSALDLATGARVGWRADERFATCSTFKAFLAAAVLERVDHGRERADRHVTWTAADLQPHSPATEAALANGLSVEELCAAIVRVSDNCAANLLLKTLGGPAGMTRWYRSLGDRVSRLDRWEVALNTALKGDPRDTASPNATVANLRAVLLGDRLSAASRAKLTGWMATSAPGPNRIKAGVPQGWTVAHKTGTGDNGATNDIGLLTAPDGRQVLLAIYLTETSASLPDCEAAIADATRAALTALGHG
jgi:beta-lactamase class A